jgi:hypothetical protein
VWETKYRLTRLRQLANKQCVFASMKISQLLANKLSWAGLSIVLCLGVASAQTLSVVESGDTWSYFNYGVAPGTDWKLPSYVEPTGPGGWANAPSSFGYNVDTLVAPANWTSNGATTRLNFSAGNNTPSNKYITTYFRKTFELTSVDFGGIVTGSRWDDGVVIYINGIEIRRQNLPTGTISNSTLATSAVNALASMTEDTYSLVLGNVNPLQVGINVISAEVHQVSSVSADVFFDLTLGLNPLRHCIGEATIGAFQDFEADFDLLSLLGDRHALYLRNPTRRKLQYDVISRVVSGWFNDPALAYSETPGESRQLVLQRNTAYTLDTERLDARNFHDVQASIDLRTQVDPNFGWNANDFIKGTLLLSSDGYYYSAVPWFLYQGEPPTILTTIIAETESNFWQVPTLSSAPTNTTTNPTDWFAFKPALWTDFRTPPPVTTANSWRQGNRPATAVRGGVGYDTNPTPVDYTPLLDAGSSLNVKTDMYNKETRINVRIPFTVPLDFAAIDKAELLLRFDDGVSVWLASDLNETSRAGLKIISDNEPISDSTVPAARLDDLAIQPKTYDITALFKAYAKVGSENVLCLRCYNAGSSSSDLLLQSKLVLTTIGSSPTNLRSLQNATGSVTTLTSPVGLIPPTTKSVKVRLECQIAGSSILDYPYIFIDNLRTSGIPIEPLDLTSTLGIQLPSSAFSSAQQQPQADPDGDGIVNLLEYAFGGHAAISGSMITLPNGQQASVTSTAKAEAGGQLSFTFRCLSGPLNSADFANNGYFELNDLRYLPQSSTDGIHWFSRQFDYVSSIDNQDGAQTVTLVCKPPLDSQSRQFCRITVSTNRESWLNPLPLVGQECVFPE